MKPLRMSIVGRTTDKGVLMINNKSEMNEFFKNWPNTSVIMEVQVYPEKGSDLLKGYYFNKVVRDFQVIFREKDGERLTLKETDLRLRRESPVMVEEIPKEESGGFHLARVKDAYECSNTELVEHIEFCRHSAATNYGTFIQDPLPK